MGEILLLVAVRLPAELGWHLLTIPVVASALLGGQDLRGRWRS